MKLNIVIVSGLMLITLVIGAIACGPDLSAPTTSPALPIDYGEVKKGYMESHNKILWKGQEIVNLLIEHEVEAVHDQFSQELKESLSKDKLQAMLRELCTDRAHFELDNVGAVFNGHLSGDNISGISVQGGSTSTFFVERSTILEPDKPIIGR